MTEPVKPERKPDPSKRKFTCPTCQANAWGKEKLHIWCGDCDKQMKAKT